MSVSRNGTSVPDSEKPNWSKAEFPRVYRAETVTSGRPSAAAGFSFRQGLFFQQSQKLKIATLFYRCFLQRLKVRDSGRKLKVRPHATRFGVNRPHCCAEFRESGFDPRRESGFVAPECG